jgi:hypothetical protein
MQPETNQGNLSRRRFLTGTVVGGGGLLWHRGEVLGALQQPAKAPFPYVQAKAFHIPPQTNTEESGYFSLCEDEHSSGTCHKADLALVALGSGV